MLMGFLLLLLTLGISTYNAYSVGSILPYAQHQGGFMKLTAMAGGIMSGIGFSMVTAVFLVFICSAFHIISPQTVQYFSSLFPALIIVPLVISGSIITISSWRAVFIKNQGGLSRVTNIALAGWNTYATASNILSMPNIFKKAFDDSDNRDVTTSAIILGIAAIASGFLIAYMLIKYFAKKEMSKYIKISVN